MANIFAAGASDQGIIEAPSLAKQGSTYVLFFSSGCFTTGNYNVNYATSSSITGSYKRAASPLFKTGTDGLTAPGGADIVRIRTNVTLVDHFETNVNASTDSSVTGNTCSSMPTLAAGGHCMRPWSRSAAQRSQLDGLEETTRNDALIDDGIRDHIPGVQLDDTHDSCITQYRLLYKTFQR